uniref:Uncharacterized protein n=1 Tax=Avena sativa TaxID=4498 RepID=A0ACD5XDU6_AVESA
MPPRREGSSRRRRGKGGEPFSGSLVESDSSSSTNSGDDCGASLPRYQSLLASRLAYLQLPPSADGDDPGSVNPRDLTPGEIVLALTRRPFLDDEMLDALVEYQVHKCLNDETQGQDSGEFHSADVAMASADSGDDIRDEDFHKDCEKMWSRKTPVDEHTKLDEQQHDELYLRHAYFRIKAFLLLKGKTIDKLDDAALERKYPPNLVAEHSYFLDYERDDAFGWYFDSNLCKLASLTDYQRLVLFNDCGDEYDNCSRYRLFYNTPETDRDYLLYWKALTEQIKWIEAYIHRGKISDEWENKWMKAKYQAIRIATDFDNIHLDLASLGFLEFIWSTRINVLLQKDLDGVFFEIWKLVIRDQVCFKEALKQVYDLRKFPSQELFMKVELDGKFRMEKQFRRCTVGITEEVPEYRARELIAQQVKNKLVLRHGYEQYAEKKLKVAEYIGLIRKTST